MNISDFPPFIRWADFRGLLGVREGFRVEDFDRLVLKYTIPTFDAELRPMTLPVDPRARGEAADDCPDLSPERLYDAVFDCPDTPEELHDAAFDWPDLSTEEGRQEFEGFQFDTLRVICALAAKGEPMNEKARAYLEAERGKVQAAKEEAERKALEAEEAAARDALFERVRAAGKSVAAGRRDGEEGKGRGHDGEAYLALNDKHNVSYKTIARAFLEGAGKSDPTDAELKKEESTLRAVASGARKKQNRHTAKGEEA